ncbi:MAG: hypothetical protein LBT89_01055 [Planctomycetaceae bacterium]|jgi:flagellin-like hook-associated protein FlgL|nr:hypothetical protein [Planctomycetaceae bacterium]
MTVVPLGLNRTSVALQTNRAYSNLASSSLLLSKYAQQVQSQRQYQYGSDSPFNASATLSIQAKIERKTQNSANIQTTQSFLSATSSTLSQINVLTDEALAAGLNAINTLTSPEERATLADTIKKNVQQLLNFGNYSYAGRYVFAGSTTGVLPFTWGQNDSYTIQYSGTQNNVYSWSDTDLLSKTNVNGSDVFGAISEPVRGTTDLNPLANAQTRLSDLNGGEGVTKGAIRLNYTADGTTQSFDIDLSRCATLGDVKRTIENFTPPSGSAANFAVEVEITNNNLVLTLKNTGAANDAVLSVSEVGKGTTARQLGIPVNTPFDSQTPLNGQDVNPAVTGTTLLSDILGSKPQLTLRFSGSNNDILIQGQHNGTDLNGVKISLQADAAVAAGSETAQYDAETNTVLVRINPDDTTANGIIQAINNAAGSDAAFPAIKATLAETDYVTGQAHGSGTVPLLAGNPVSYGELTGGSGSDFDLTGLQIVNDNRTMTVSFAECKTVGELLAELNDPEYGLYAEINEAKNGINIRSRVSGADFCIGENGGITAHQLGVRTTDFDTLLTDLDYGRGVNDYDGPGTAAYAQYHSVSPNADLILTARSEGTAWNDYTLKFVPTQDPDGKITVVTDEEAKTVTIGINPGVTTACEVTAAFYELPGPKQYFDLALDATYGANNGSGVVYDGFTKTAEGTDGGIDFVITRNDGTVLEIDIKGAKTIGDVLNIINGHSGNQDGKLTASLTPSGNGITLTDTSTGNAVLRVDRTLLSTAAVELGLVNDGEEYRIAPQGATEEAGVITPASLTGTDPNPQETESLYNALIRLQRGMETNDEREIERALQLLEAAVTQTTESQTTLGVLQRSLDNTAMQLADENVLFEQTLNETLRIDYADASLNYLGQQLSYQGSMQVTSMMLQLSLLNYL